jgi:hypothetical protein
LNSAISIFFRHFDFGQLGLRHFYESSYQFREVRARVARWFIFKPKIPIRVGGLGIENIGIFYDHLEYLMAVG